jgi:hypothetical protein
MENDVIGMKGNNNLELPCFLLGLGAGVGLTLLFAPRTGDATRRLISRGVRRQVRNGENWVKDQATATQEYVAGQAEAVGNRVKEAAKAIGHH